MDFQHFEYDKLIAFAADELGSSEANAVATHTASCAECSKSVNFFHAIRRLMRADNEVEPPPAAKERAYSIFSDVSTSTQHVPDSLLVAFATDDLEPSDVKKLASHIHSCTACSQTVTHYRSMRLLFLEGEGHAPPAATLTRAYGLLNKRRLIAAPKWEWIHSLTSLPPVRRLAIAMVLVLFLLSNILVYTTLADLVPTAYAAIPGDSLYPVKRNFEQIELVITWDTAGKLDKHLAFAGYRVDEVAALINIERNAEIPNTLTAFEAETNLIAQTYNVLVRENVSRARALGSKVQEGLANVSKKLSNLRSVAGDVVAPLIDHAMTTAASNQRIVGDVVNQLLNQPPSPGFATITPTDTTQSGTPVFPPPTGVLRPGVTATTGLPVQNTPSGLTPVAIPSAVNTPRPTSQLIGPSVTRTSTPQPIVPTLTRTPTAAPTGTNFIPPGQLKKTPTNTP